jgi:hypothetical protein
LFKVARNTFRDSAVFQDMLSMPQPSGDAVDGADADHPLRLDGLSASEFKIFLGAVMFLCVFHSILRFISINELLSSGYPRPSLDLDKSSWISLLRLSTMWQISSLRLAAIARLTRLLTAETDAAEKLDLGDRYDVPQWSISALTAFVNREDGLTMADMEKLGIERLLKIARLRETKLKSQSHENCHVRRCSCYHGDKNSQCEDLEGPRLLPEEDVAAAFRS